MITIITSLLEKFGAWVYIVIAIVFLAIGFKCGLLWNESKVQDCENVLREANLKALELQNRIQTVITNTTEEIHQQIEQNRQERDQIIEDYRARMTALEQTPREKESCTLPTPSPTPPSVTMSVSEGVGKKDRLPVPHRRGEEPQNIPKKASASSVVARTAVESTLPAQMPLKTLEPAPVTLPVRVSQAINQLLTASAKN
jgi:hypothetical protein